MQSNKINVLKRMLGMMMVGSAVLSLSLFAADPVNYWELDETSGPTYVDSIGGADGTCLDPDGCPTSTDGQIYGAQSFDGNDTIEVANTANFDWTADANATIEFWMKSLNPVVGAGGDVMIGRTTTDPSVVLWYVGVDTNGSIRAQIDDGNSGNGVTGTAVINDGNWNHIAYVLKPGQVRVFVNGENDFNITRTATNLSSVTNVTIGNLYSALGREYTGQLDDIKLYATDLNGSTIKEHYEDGLKPHLIEVTAVPNPTNDTTPDYTFSSDKAGVITYGGSCTSATTAAIAGDNTITFNALADGIYSDCTITVTDTASNPSLPLAVTEFTVDTTIPDTTAPILEEVTPVPNPTTDPTPDYTFSSDEAGVITYGGSCTSAETAAIAGDNTITFNALADGIYSDCTITVTDTASNPSLPLAVSEFTVDTTVPTPTDTTAPTLIEVTMVPNPTADPTPDYTFSSDEAGTITYGGSCTSAATAAIAGDNTITFDALADGLYNDCTITVTDASSNSSDALAVTEFVVDTTVPTPTDTPVLGDGGGGCTYNPDSKNFDMTFLLMMALGLLYPFRRRFIK